MYVYCNFYCSPAKKHGSDPPPPHFFGAGDATGDRRIVVVGIISRSDLGDYYESKRLGINIRLERKCEAMGVKYVEMGGQFKDRDSLLWDDGLHLNDAGAYKMGKAIFERIFPRFLSQRRPGVRGD